jgi:hypothetical protein
MISMGYYASQGGLLIAGTIAFMAGTGAAAMVDPARRGLNTAIVAFYIAVPMAAEPAKSEDAGSGPSSTSPNPHWSRTRF